MFGFGAFGEAAFGDLPVSGLETRLAAATGEFAFTGNPVVNGPAAFTLTGSATTFHANYVPPHASFATAWPQFFSVTLFADARGVFALTGQSAAFRAMLTAVKGAFVMTGVAATFPVRVPHSVGAFSLSGAATLFVSKMVAAKGSFVTAWPQFLSITMIAEMRGEFLLIGNAAILAKNWHAAFDWSGEGTMDFDGTTSFIDLVESGEALLTYGADIHLRSL